MADAAIRSLIADVADFPRPGISFLDVTPLMASPQGFAAAVDGLAAAAGPGIDVVAGVEARGFIFGAPVALALGVGFVPVRKPGRLPRPTVSTTYALEYGTETLAIHTDAIPAGARVFIVDDVLATGGTVVATAGLVRRLGGEVAGVGVVVELDFLGGRPRLAAAGLEHVTALCVAAEEPRDPSTDEA